MKSKRQLMNSQAQSTRKANDPSDSLKLPDPSSKRSEHNSLARNSPKAATDHSKLDYAQLRKMLEAGLESSDPEAM